MADFKYKIDWVPDAKKQRNQVAEEAMPQGIASRPTPTKPAKKEDDYYTKMYNIMSAYFDTDEEAEQALSSKKPDAAKAKQITMEEFERMTEASADRGRAMREDRGITQSLVEGGGEAYRTKPPEGTITRPVARPDELVTDTAKDVEESAPVTAETEDTGLDDDAMGLPSDAGLMTRPKTRPESLTQEETAATYSTAVEDLYTDFTKGGQEGAEAHIGQDEQNITLPAGIVADGLKYDGKPVTQGSNTIKKAGFDKTKLDTSGAYKKVNGVKIKRSDYTSDVDFSKAVLEGFEDVAKTKAGTDWDSMPAAAKKAMLKVGWNKGEGWLKGSTAGAAYKELAKTNPSATALYPKILTGSTLAPKKDGTVQGASIGIAKARADAMNTLKDVLGVNEITKVVADNSGTNTAFKYYDSAGTLVHTEQTDRAASLYTNKTVEVAKNKKGVW